MGWLLFGLMFMISIALIGSVYARIQRNKKYTNDHPLGHRIREECAKSSNYVGNFAIELSEMNDFDWLELSNSDSKLDDFSFTVKWRNYGTRCDYRIVATSSEETGADTITSEKYSLNLK